MGRLLGAFDNDQELDRPDLNKCPDCGCFFAQDNCPLCGKVCPENMRAGNRKAVKVKKTRGSSGRVTFINWYHTWWFILIMFFVFPVAAIVLLATSPYRRSVKITVVSIVAVLTVISYIGIGNIIFSIMNLWDKPVDTSLSKEEYITACDTVDADEFYHAPKEYEDKFVSMTLTVIDKIVDAEGEYRNLEYTTYYICSPEDNSRIRILVRNCIREGASNFVSGDVITVYGEGAGEVTVYDEEYQPSTAPCVNTAFVTINN